MGIFLRELEDGPRLEILLVVRFEYMYDLDVLSSLRSLLYCILKTLLLLCIVRRGV